MLGYVFSRYWIIHVLDVSLHWYHLYYLLIVHIYLYTIISNTLLAICIFFIIRPASC